MTHQSDSRNNQGQVNQPWYKHRWPWLLMAGPFIAFVACGVTIWLTFSAVDPQIKDGVVKRGLKVTVPGKAPEAAAIKTGESK
jgi:hypothetical protein